MKNFLTYVVIFLLLGALGKGCEDKNLSDNPYSRHLEFCKCEYEFRGETLKLIEPQKKEEQILDEIIDQLGLNTRPFNLCKAKKLDGYTVAFATNRNGKNMIVYDAEYFSQTSLNSARRTMAHEVGHLLHVHSLENGVHDHEQELEADHFSGGVLFNYGVSYEDAVNLISEGQQATEQHPSGRLRRQKISDGWLKAAGRAGQSVTSMSLSSLNRNTHKPVTKRVNYAELTVRDFIRALGKGEYRTAYALQNVPAWGSHDYFSSVRSFGGITETRIIESPKLKKCFKTAGDGTCLTGQVYVRYYAKDPVNDECGWGKRYSQYFLVSKMNEGWKITKSLVSEMECR